MENFCKYCADREDNYDILDLTDPGGVIIPLRVKREHFLLDLKSKETTSIKLRSESELTMWAYVYDNTLSIEIADVSENEYQYEPNDDEYVCFVSVPINYCPMCGRRLIKGGSNS